MLLSTFFTPEFMVLVAFDAWREAKRITVTKHAHGAFYINLVVLYNHPSSDRGHHWWKMAHSHFVLIGGFVLHDNTGFQEINANKFLLLVEVADIVNPVITEHEIIHTSKSNALGKAILIAQLAWFMIEILFRLVNHFSVTLVKLDVVCLGVLMFPLIFFWWNKPPAPGCPHIFYTQNTNVLGIETSQWSNDLEKLLVSTIFVLAARFGAGVNVPHRVAI